MIARIIEKQIQEKLFQWKIIILYGARQVGKTTLSKKIISEYAWKFQYLNCDLYSTQQVLDYKNPEKFIQAFRNEDFIVLDEAQNIPNIWMILKILGEEYPQKQFIATGSSSFDLANILNEALTGRNFKFFLYGISIEELLHHYDTFYVEKNIENFLLYGSYPEVLQVSQDQKQEQLNLLSGDYLYRDVFKLDGIKKSSYVQSILQLLALQLWNEVSYNEIAQQLGLHRATVQKYINLLEQAFIIFTLSSFSRNARNEIRKGVKIYFYDLWVRNSLVQNFNSLNIRDDRGALWENFLIIERKKYLQNNKLYRNIYFWRNHLQAKIDYVEEYDGGLHTYEFKWKEKKAKIPKAFLDSYPNSTFSVIHQNNFLKFVG